MAKMAKDKAPSQCEENKHMVSFNRYWVGGTF